MKSIISRLYWKKPKHRILRHGSFFRPQELQLLWYRSWGDGLYGPEEFLTYEEAEEFLIKRKRFLRNNEK